MDFAPTPVSEVEAQLAGFVEAAQDVRVDPDRHPLGGEGLEFGNGFRLTE